MFKIVITNEKKQSLFCLTANVENNYSFNKFDIKNDEFKVKCLIEGAEPLYINLIGKCCA